MREMKNRRCLKTALDVFRHISIVRVLDNFKTKIFVIFSSHIFNTKIVLLEQLTCGKVIAVSSRSS